MWPSVHSMSTSRTSNSKTLNDIQGQCRRLNSVGLGFQKPTECSTIPLPTVTAAAGLLDSGRHHVHYMR